MAKNKEDVNILIIEDHEDDFKYLKEALENIGFNVFPEEFIAIKVDESIYIKYREILDDLFKKSILIHTIFFDLNLKDTDKNNKGGSGAELISEFLNHNLYRYIPKVIFTGIEDFSDIDPTVEQEVKIIIKKPSDRAKYKDKLIKEKINVTLPVFAELYENLSNAINISSRLDNIDYKLTSIQIIVQQIAKTLPKITDKSKANKIIDEWLQDESFKKEMDCYFPDKRDGLFNKLNDFKDSIKENAAEALYEQAVNYFESEAEIDAEDDTKMIKLVKYSAYIAEKIGEAVK
jgi:response regulator RpfG family c-di-GMP phosphodiesterase